MSKTLLYILFFGFLAYSSSEIQAQDLDDPLAPAQKGTPIYIGPVVGYNYAMHTIDRQVIGPPEQGQDAGTSLQGCPSFADGSSNGFYAGVAVEYLIGGSKNSTSSIIAKLLYSTMPSYMEQGGAPLPTTLAGLGSDSQEPVETTVNFSNEVQYSVASLELLYKINIGGTPIGAVVGVANDLVMTSTETEKMTLLTPENGFLIPSPEAQNQNYRYDNPDTPRELFFKEDSDIQDASAFRFALKAGLQYEISFPGIIVVPHIFYNFGLTQVNPDNDWRVNALQIGVDVRFAW